MDVGKPIFFRPPSGAVGVNETLFPLTARWSPDRSSAFARGEGGRELRRPAIMGEWQRHAAPCVTFVA